MLKVFATQVVVSPGYEGAPALRFSEKGDAVRFRIGKKVYDPHAENECRWINLSVKAFGPVCERIKKMQLKDGSFINLTGRLDEDVWADKTTGERKTSMVIILDDIEYASGGGKKEKAAGAQNPAPQYAAPQNTAPQYAAPQNAAAPGPAPAAMPGFTGYEPFGGASFFDEG